MANGASRDSDHERIAWDHALHEERVLNERSGLFLVAEAMLLVFYATINASASRLSLRLFTGAGLVMSCLWTILSLRQARDLLDSAAILKRVSSFYKDYVRTREDEGYFRKWDQPILVYALPALVGFVWLVLLLTGTGILGL
jgi:hypothetical protein